MNSPSIQKLSIVVPCFNEAANLKRFLDEVAPVFQKWDGEHEFIFVDDGSTDETPQVIAELSGRLKNVVAVHHERNRGLGAALQTGFSKATGDAILTLDADLTFHPNHLPKMLEVYAPQVDCVMGSPFLGKMQGVSFYRRILSWGVNTIYRILLEAEVSSVSSIFRLYRASCIRSLQLSCTSFDINAEIIFQILTLGGEIKEVPVTLGTRIHGTSKINTAREIKNHLKMFSQIIRWKMNSRKRPS